MARRRNTPDKPTGQPAPNPTLFRREILIGGESAEEFSALHEQYRLEYRPDTPLFEQAVLRATEADWLLRREHKQLDRAERSLFLQFESAADWSAEQHKSQRELARRVDRAERELQRLRGPVEQMRRSRLTENIRLDNQRMRNESHEAKMKRMQADAASERKNKKVDSESKEAPPVPEKKTTLCPPEKMPFFQYIEARVVEGETITIRNPPNHIILAMLHKMGRPDQVVKRSMHFPAGIPPGYEWAIPADGRILKNLVWSMPEADFEIDAQREADAGDNLVLESKYMPILREVVLLG